MRPARGWRPLRDEHQTQPDRAHFNRQRRRAARVRPTPPGQKLETLCHDHGTATSRKRWCHEPLVAGGRSRWRTTHCNPTPPKVECAGRQQSGARGDGEEHRFASWPCFYHGPLTTTTGTPLYRLPLWAQKPLSSYMGRKTLGTRCILQLAAPNDGRTPE
jgi:hypothetical protein